MVSMMVFRQSESAAVGLIDPGPRFQYPKADSREREAKIAIPA